MNRLVSSVGRTGCVAWHWLRRTFAPSRRAWSAASAAMFGLWAALFLSLAVGVVFPRYSLEKMAGYLAVFAMLAMISGLLLLLSWLARRAPARFLASFFLALTPLALVLAIVWGPKGVAIAVPTGLAAL